MTELSAVELAAEAITETEARRLRAIKHATMVHQTSGPGYGFTATCLWCGPIVGDVPMAIAQTWARVHSGEAS